MHTRTKRELPLGAAVFPENRVVANHFCCDSCAAYFPGLEVLPMVRYGGDQVAAYYKWLESAFQTRFHGRTTASWVLISSLLHTVARASQETSSSSGKRALLNGVTWMCRNLLKSNRLHLKLSEGRKHGSVTSFFEAYGPRTTDVCLEVGLNGTVDLLRAARMMNVSMTNRLRFAFCAYVCLLTHGFVENHLMKKDNVPNVDVAKHWTRTILGLDISSGSSFFAAKGTDDHDGDMIMVDNDVDEITSSAVKTPTVPISVVDVRKSLVNDVYGLVDGDEDFARLETTGKEFAWAGRAATFYLLALFNFVGERWSAERQRKVLERDDAKTIANELVTKVAAKEDVAALMSDPMSVDMLKLASIVQRLGL
jgi:hypothetical protein